MTFNGSLETDEIQVSPNLFDVQPSFVSHKLFKYKFKKAIEEIAYARAPYTRWKI